MKKTKYFLASLAAVMILTAGVGQAMAYFTTYTEVKGTRIIRLGDETKITEELESWTKVLTISSAKGSEPVFVRARVFYSTQGTNAPSVSGDGWSTTVPEGTEIDKADELMPTPPNSTRYYYYDKPVLPDVLDENGKIKEKRSANELRVSIENIVPKDVVNGDTFNVIVVYESTPVFYKEDGTAYADWTSKLVGKGETVSKPDTPLVPDKDKKPDTGDEKEPDTGDEEEPDADNKQNNGEGGGN